MEKMIKVQLSDTEQQELMKSLNDGRKIMKAVSVGLSDMQKTGVRSMAEGREGFARMVSKIAVAHVDSLAREHDPAELEGKLAYDSTLEDMRQSVMALHEMIEETQLANSMDIMSLVDKYAANLDTSRKGNEALDMALREVDDYNKRFGERNKSKTPVTADAPAS
jgi:hypothetical protein